ncbi:MAG: hypothetical protein J6S10_03415 [Clostridia bacterium]|nr:hypothetical protein [Clostridia bacterium]MBO7250956.1 hypothetical protein [Clostridia bacterium]
MKSFFSDYSYSAVKMFVNQFAISIFGAMLSMATTAAENDTLAIVCSVLAIVFYLFLIYTQTWEIGARDRISVDIGKKPYRPNTGLAISALANVPNILIAIVFFIVLKILPQTVVAGNTGVIASLFNMLLQGMYLGIITAVKIGEYALKDFWVTYFAIILPAMLTSWLAYYLGFKNKKFTTLFDYQSPDKSKRK